MGRSETREAPDASGTPLVARAEYGWALGAAAVVTLATAVPYLVAWAWTPLGQVWMGTTHNGMDTAVHWSWIAQAREGSFFLSNLFATEPQSGRFVHLWAWGIGALSALLQVPYVAVYHASRLLFTFTTVVLVYRLAAFVAGDPRARRWATAAVCVGAGLGWIVGLSGAPFGSADLVQPEVVTFQALYTSGLFAFSLTLFLLALVSLLEAERSGSSRWALAAGVAALLLVNVHTYDVVPLAAAWVAHLIVGRARRGAFSRPALRATAIAAAVAAPGVAWTAWYFLSDPVLQARVAVATASPPPGHYAVGFGLLLPLAVLGVSHESARRDMVLLLAAWAILQLGLGYAPVPFQRKLLMGVHVPIAMLAGLGLARIGARHHGRAVATVLLVLAALSNLFFVARDLNALSERRGDLSNFATYVPRDVYEGFVRARALPRSAVVAATPGYSPHVAAVAGRTTLPGHWGETPDYDRKRALVTGVLAGEMSLGAFAGETGATHLLVDGRLIELP